MSFDLHYVVSLSVVVQYIGGNRFSHAQYVSTLVLVIGSFVKLLKVILESVIRKGLTTYILTLIR